MRSLLEGFRDPPDEYSAVGMWWWDMGYLTEPRIHNQIQEMKLRGIGTSCIMSHYGPEQRYSTEPAYFTDEWWELVKFSLEAQKIIGMKQWFCDWLGRCDKQYWQNELRTYPELTGQWLAWDDSGVFIEDGDLNYLDRVTVDKLIEIFFNVYAEKLGDLLGDVLTAYMPDEKTILAGRIPYSDSLVERFKKEKGYDPWPHLNGLFTDIDGFFTDGKMTEKIRCDYYDIMVTMLEENYYKPIADWLHEHGMLYTNHSMWGKGDILGAVTEYGDYFRMMRYFDMPGLEDVRMRGGVSGDFRYGKMVSSIAHLYKKKRVIGESSWNSGWNVATAYNLAWINENYAYGVNCYMQLGAFYGLPGGWFYPSDQSSELNQPYWQERKRMADYVKRLSFILSQGVHVTDVAFLYPITSIHAGWVGGKEFTDAAKETAEATFSLSQSIYESGIDFDFIDDDSIQCSEIDNGKLKVSGLEFSVLVLPPMTTINSDTLVKIQEFEKSGGAVIRCKDSSVDIAKLIRDAITIDVIISEKDIIYTHQRTDNTDIYFFYNARPEKRGSFFEFKMLGFPERWDAFTGQSSPVHYKIIDDKMEVCLGMEPYEGMLIIFKREEI